MDIHHDMAFLFPKDHPIVILRAIEAFFRGARDGGIFGAVIAYGIHTFIKHDKSWSMTNACYLGGTNGLYIGALLEMLRRGVRPRLIAHLMAIAMFPMLCVQLWLYLQKN